MSSETTTTGAAAEELLRDAGALLEGHFQLASGKHSSLYIEKFRLLERPPQTQELCAMIAEWARSLDPGIVAGPTTGGIIISYEVARLLGLCGIFAERNEEGPGRSFRRGFEIGPRQRVLVVDDVLTTGGSIQEIIAAVHDLGGEVAGVAVLVDRAAGTADFGVPFFACLALELPVYEPQDCPLCREGLQLKIT